jgi:hypothetical protein
MASFTDEIQKFNPYIEQLPVDDYIKVGMMAQGQYNAGIQSVQGAIDTISGMPIVRDIDKQYVRSALTKLQDQVKNVASSDFRNQQLVNQIHGATRSIARDKNVQAAVASAAFISKEQEFIEKQRAEGKTSPENEWDWANEYQKYITSSKLGEQFSYKYTPFRDVRKKVIDTLKAINPDAKINDNIFDANGNISDVMLREQFKGVSPDKIKQAILASLDEGDMRQLSISGRYSMANYDASRLQGVAINAIASQRTFIAAKKKQLEDTKAGLSSVPEQLAIQKKIDALSNEERMIGDEERFYMERLTSGRLDEVRSQLYSQQFLNQFGNAFAYTELSQTYLNNPAAEMAMKREEMKQTWDKFILEYNQKERFHVDDITLKEKEIDAKNKSELGDLGGVPQTVNQSDLPDVNVGAFKSKTEELEKNIVKEEAEFLKTQGKDKAWLQSQRILYDQGKDLDPLVKDYFQRLEGAEKEVNANKSLVLDLEKEADKNIGVVDAAFDNETGLTYYPDKGDRSNGVSFSAQEMLNLEQRFNKYFKVGYSQGESKSTYDEAGANKEFANGKERLFLDMRLRQARGGDLSSGERAVMHRTQELVGKIGPKVNKLLKDRSAFMDQELQNRTGETQRVAYTLPTGKAEQRTAVRDRMNNLLARASDQKNSFGSETIRANYKAIKEMNDDDKSTYSLVVKDKTQFGEAKYWVRINNGENKYQDVPISKEDKEAIFGNRFQSADNPQYSPIDNKIRATNNGSTNFSGTADPVKAFPTAFFTRNDFGGVKNFSVKGDVVTQSGRQALVLYVYEPKSKTYNRIVYAPPTGLMDKNQVTAAVNGITDAVIYQKLYNKAPTPEDMKEIEELNKKALN